MLAAATFASVRSANRAARVAEVSVMANLRDPASGAFQKARRAIEARETLGVSVMYGDLEGGQRTITRFAMVPKPDGDWLISAGRVWNVDRPAPR